MSNVPNDPQPRHLPTVAVAQALDCSVDTVHRLVRTGDLVPAFKAPGIRGAMFFRPADVRRLVKQRGRAA